MRLKFFLILALCVASLKSENDEAEHQSREVRKAAFYSTGRKAVHFAPHPLHQRFPPGWSPSLNYPPRPAIKTHPRPVLVQHVPRKVPHHPAYNNKYNPTHPTAAPHQPHYTPHPAPHPVPAPPPPYNPRPTNPSNEDDDEDRDDIDFEDNDSFGSDDDDENPLNPPRDYFPPPNIVRLLEDEGETTLLSLLEQVDLLDELKKNRGEYTLFAPSNEAFAKLDRDTIDTLRDDRDLLESVLKYHLVPKGRLFSKIIKDDLTAPTLNNGATIRFNVNGDLITVNGAEFDLDRVDQRASNGVVHFINDVIYPIPTKTIYDVLNDDSRFATLVRAIEIADLEDALNGDQALTVFAPTDDAFEQISSQALDELLSDKDALRELLLKHVVRGTKLSQALTFVNLETESGNEISIRTRRGRVLVEDARLVDGDILATNGAVQVIDRVLL